MSDKTYECRKPNCFHCQEMKRLEELRNAYRPEFKIQTKSERRRVYYLNSLKKQVS